MPRESRAEASARRQRQMMDAGLELFLEAGVGSCRLEDLLEQSGASVGSFYHHFGGKPELAAALYLEILEEFHTNILRELRRHKSTRAAIRGVIGKHLDWVASDPTRASFLFQCLEPEVAAVCVERDNEMTLAFLGEGFRWLDRKAAEGDLRKLPPLEYYALWMGPTLELTRTWLLNVKQRWTWMTADQRRPESLLSAKKTLADAAWQALRART